MNPFENMTAPEYDLDQRVWIKVPLNYLVDDNEEPPVFECEVIDITLEAKLSSITKSPQPVYKYELMIVSSFDSPLTRTAEDIFATEAEACAACIKEVSELIDKRVARTSVYQDILNILKTKAGEIN